MAEDGMVRATGDDPGFRSGTQIRLRFPQGVGHRQLRQIVRRRDGFNGIDQQTEAISQIDQAGDNRRAGLGIEDQTRRIRFAADTQRLDVEDRFLSGSDRRAHFQHMRTEHQVVAVVEVVGVILHKGGAALQTG